MWSPWRVGPRTDRPAGGRTARRARRVLVVVAGAVLALVAVPAPASAHASLVGTAPANGEHLDTAPAEVVLRFSEAVSLVRDGVVLLSTDGSKLNKRPATRRPGTADEVVLPVPAHLGDGVYTVSWRVISADSHPVYGAFVFSVGNARAAPLSDATAQSNVDSGLAAVFWFFRWLGYAALALLAGGLIFLALCWPNGWSSPRARRILVLAWAASTGSAVAVLLLQGPYGSGGTLAGVADPAAIGATLGTDYGRYVLARLGVLAVGGALLMMLLRKSGRGATPHRAASTVAAVVLGVALPATWSGTGHAHAEPGPLPVLSDASHLMAMATWVGGLVMLGTCLLPRSAGQPVPDVARGVTRFSRIAMTAVAVLVVTGTYQAWRGVGSLDALPGSAYGRLLVFKVAALGLLLCLASLSRSVVQRRYATPAAATGTANASTRSRRREARAEQAQEQAARRRLARSVRWELTVAVAVLGLTSILVATPPGARGGAAPVALPLPQAAASSPGVFTTRLALTGGGSVEAVLDPARVGTNQLRITVRDAAGKDWDVPEVSDAFALPARDLGPLRPELTRLAPGSYLAKAVTLPMGGAWRLSITVRTTEIDQYTVRTQVQVS